jgi:hypothetical protein
MATSSQPALKNPIRLIINTTILIFIVLFLIYIALKLILIYSMVGELNSQMQNAIQDFLIKLESIAENIWIFVKPFLQLGIILVIIEWLLSKLGVSLLSRRFTIEWNIQTIIALIIVSAFAIAALGSVGNVDYLKDLALVVVGFYFGSQKKVSEYSDNDKMVKKSEELANEQASKPPPAQE